jgi:hypothetical protein
VAAGCPARPAFAGGVAPPTPATVAT